VLWTAEPPPAPRPTPITREHFHALLTAGGDVWRPWLLLGLNLCLHLDEVCDLAWADFDLERATYAAIRKKTRRQRIPRAATLWPETVAALRALARRGKFVLISTHGTRYNRNTRGNAFAELRALAGVPDDVTFDHIRDGSYTSAANAPGVDEKFARVLAGQKSPGLQDNYVLRNPGCLEPACNAVYAKYGPFTPPKR
jgi:integrase